MVKEVTSGGDFENEIKKTNLTVVDFYADWCGPCRNIAPFVEQLSQKYPKVNFIKVNADKSEVSQQRGVSALPTFQFYIQGRMVDEMKGANPQGLENKVIQHKVEPQEAFTGKGFSLGATSNPGSVAAPTPESFREARLRAYQSSQHASTPSTAPKALTQQHQQQQPQRDAMDVDGDDELAKAIALSMEENASKPPPSDATTATKKSVDAAEQDRLDVAEAEAEQALEDQQWGEEMVPVPVNADLLQELLEMGFTDIRSRKGLVHGSTVEGALQWITEHENDPDIDQPYMVKKSDTMPKPVLTEEEKAAKLLEMKEKIRLRKEEKIRLEKEAEIKREKERRERGKTTNDIQEERDRLMRMREAEKQKKEKQDAEKERQRLRAEIARDKELRKLNKGVLPSVLGVDGYNPSAVNNNAATIDPVTTTATTEATKPTEAAKPVAVKEMCSSL